MPILIILQAPTIVNPKAKPKTLHAKMWKFFWRNRGRGTCKSVIFSLKEVKTRSKMPVGCLGGISGSNGRPYGDDRPGGGREGGGQDMEVIVTSSVLNAAEQFAFMQQTLLMQIFRINPNSSANSINGNSGLGNPLTNSGPAASSTSPLTCPTCIAFSDQCCQHENGLSLFQEFIEANIHCCVWEQRLSDALASLRLVEIKLFSICILPHALKQILCEFHHTLVNQKLIFQKVDGWVMTNHPAPVPCIF